jgi:hypothetical protein
MDAYSSRANCRFPLEPATFPGFGVSTGEFSPIFASQCQCRMSKGQSSASPTSPMRSGHSFRVTGPRGIPGANGRKYAVRNKCMGNKHLAWSTRRDSRPFSPVDHWHPTAIQGRREICLFQYFYARNRETSLCSVPCKILLTAHFPVIAPGTPRWARYVPWRSNPRSSMPTPCPFA